MRPDSAEDDEALGSMLIAWYMSGYHTGYYLVRDTFLLKCLCNFTFVLLLPFSARSWAGGTAFWISYSSL